MRLKIAYCGICGSDIHEYLAAPIFAPAHGTRHEFTGVEIPVSLGHEMSGTVVEIGDNVTKVRLISFASWVYYEDRLTSPLAQGG